MAIETVTDLINRLFSAYECNLSGLNWEDKINEYSDVINDVIDYDTDLDSLYKKIRQQYPYRKLPTPHDIIQIINKNKTRQIDKTHIEHPDNMKVIVVVCYIGDEVKDIRNYVVMNTGNGNNRKEILHNLNSRYERIKIWEFKKGTTLIGDTVFIPKTYNQQGEITEYEKQKVA